MRVRTPRDAAARATRSFEQVLTIAGHDRCTAALLMLYEARDSVRRGAPLGGRSASEDALAQLDALARGERRSRVLVVVAHPDDEVLWAGATLADHRDVCFVHLTDGAPRDPFFAHAAQCGGEREYAALRARELEEALAILGLGRAKCITLGARDQEAALTLVPLARGLAEVIEALAPSVVIAHAYDGGHPDHDAAAFVARAALSLASRTPSVLIDAAGYHAGAQGLEVGFLPRPENVHARAITLSDGQCDRKRRALACFASQRQVIERLDTTTERLRPGAREDFGAPPHDGPLHYETHGWAIDGAKFRARVREAALALEVPEVLA